MRFVRVLSFLSHLLYAIAGMAITVFFSFCLLTMLAWFICGPYDLDGYITYIILGVSIIIFGIPGFVLGFGVSETLDSTTEDFFFRL